LEMCGILLRWVTPSIEQVSPATTATVQLGDAMFTVAGYSLDWR
jgi:hypothetical protein